MNNVPLDDQSPSAPTPSKNATEHQRNEVRFWQGVSLSLAIFVLSVLASLVLGLGFLLLNR